MLCEMSERSCVCLRAASSYCVSARCAAMPACSLCNCVAKAAAELPTLFIAVVSCIAIVSKLAADENIASASVLNGCPILTHLLSSDPLVLPAAGSGEPSDRAAVGKFG